MAQRVKIDDLEIDATPEQDYQGDVETTDSPVEDGADTTDHAREKPETFTATCVVSSVPVDELDRQTRGPFQAGASGGYARGVYARMRRMKSERKLHSITTPLRTYENMMLVTLSAPTRAQYGDGVVFKVGFKEIRIVKSGTAQFVSTTKTTATEKPVDKKKQSKKTGEPAEQRRSALKGLFDAGGITTPGSGVAAP